MNKKEKLTWDIELNEFDPYVLGRIPKAYKVNGDEPIDLVSHLGEEVVDNLIMDAIIAVLPYNKIILNTPGPSYQDWLKYPKRTIRKKFLFFLIDLYVDLMHIIKFVFRVKNKKFIKHLHQINRSLYDDISRAYLSVVKKDGIKLIKEDKIGRYYLKLNSSQLPKYLDAFGHYRGVPYYFDTLAVPKGKEKILSKEEIEFISEILIYRRGNRGKNDIKKIKSIMKDNLIVCILYEGYFFYLAQSQEKARIIKQLSRVAEKYDLAINF